MLLSLVLACTGSDGTPTGDVDLVLSEMIPTVVSVSWEADPDATEASVQFGNDSTRPWTAPATLVDGRWQATLLGLKPETEASLVTVEVIDGTASQGEALSIETGANSALPYLSTSVQEEGGLADGFLVGALITAPAAAVIIDPDGQIVWGYVDTAQDMLGRARLSRDGQSVWMMGINAHNLEENSLLQVALDGTELQRIDVGAGHHDFVELEDGSLAWLSHELQEVDGVNVLGDSLTVRAPDGSTSTLWSIFDWREYDGSEGLEGENGNGNPIGGGVIWTHCNSLAFQDGAWYLGSLGLSAIMKIDATTGELLWTFGSKTSDFTDAEGDPSLLSFQHHFQVLDDSLLIFENGSTERSASRAVEFSFDQQTPVVEEIWTYEPDPDLYTFSLGNPQRLPDGSTLVNFATSGQIDQVSPEGEVVWRLSSYLGTAFGYMEWVESLY